MFQSLKPFNEFSQTTAVQKYANKITLPISNKKDQYDNSATLFLLTSFFCTPVPRDEKDIFFFGVLLVLESVVSLHRTIKFHLPWHM